MDCQLLAERRDDRRRCSLQIKQITTTLSFQWHWRTRWMKGSSCPPPSVVLLFLQVHETYQICHVKIDHLQTSIAQVLAMSWIVAIAHALTWCGELDSAELVRISAAVLCKGWGDWECNLLGFLRNVQQKDGICVKFTHESVPADLPDPETRFYIGRSRLFSTLVHLWRLVHSICPPLHPSSSLSMFSVLWQEN
jgi:hypothetical protein